MAAHLRFFFPHNCKTFCCTQSRLQEHAVCTFHREKMKNIGNKGQYKTKGEWFSCYGTHGSYTVMTCIFADVSMMIPK